MYTIPMRQDGKEPFHLPLSLQYSVFAPTSEYPFLQLKWYWDPSTEPLPLTKPLDNDEGRTGHTRK